MELLKNILRRLAMKVLERYHPVVIAVAGSVGKTSTRGAVTAAISKSFRARMGAKNFNNEFGVPLTILGEHKTGGKNPFAWAFILGRGAWLAWGPTQPYPNALVLEMATDHPGDIAYLTAIAPPDVAVVTAVAEEHTEFLGDLDGVAKEEGMVIEALARDGVAVLNADDPRVMAMRTRTKGTVTTFGFGPDADVRAEAIETENAMGTFFTRFDLVVKGKRVPATLSGCIGNGNVAAALAGAAVAVAMGVKPELVPFSLAAYVPPPGRMRPIAGVHGALLIDDTYNSSPRAVELALQTLVKLPAPPGARRIAVLGDMLELGALSEESHRRAGALAASLDLDGLICVGGLSTGTCEEAEANGLPEARIHQVEDAREAAKRLQNELRSGDVVLIKGSQGVRMERTVKALMAEPERASELLVRQSQDWQ